MGRVRFVFGWVMIVALLAVLGTAQEASAQFQIRFEQAGFAPVTLTDNGAGDLNPTLGLLTFLGNYGTFTGINVATGLSKPMVGNGTTEAHLDLNVSYATPSGGTLLITLADTGYSFPSNPLTFTAAAGGTFTGPAGSTVSFQSWVNTANQSPLASDPTSIPAGSIPANPAPFGPFVPGSFSTLTTTNVTRGPGAYAIFTQALIDMTGSGRGGFDHVNSITGPGACSGAIGDFVWNDLNHNGVQDSGEPGIPEISVELRDNANFLLATTTTDASGRYHFTGLCSNNYIVVVPLQAGLTGYLASPVLQGNPDADSNPNPFQLFLPPDVTDNSVDFGYYLPLPHLTIAKTPELGTFIQGDQASFTILVGNDGGSPAGNVQLTDQLPSNGGIQWTGFTTTQGNCTISSGNLLQCSLGSIPAGGFVTVQVTTALTTPASACQSQPNPIANVTANGGLEAQDSGSLTCVPPAQLAVSKTPDNGSFIQGGAISFEITVSNPAPTGSSSATNVVLTDSLPGNGGLVWMTAVAAQGSCTISSNSLICNLGTIHPGGAVIVTVTSAAPTPALACQSQPNPVALATADGGLQAQDSGLFSCTPPPPTANCIVINAVQGVAITPVTLTGSGGVGGSYTFSATGLPAGLTMSSGGTISGTPTASGTFNYTVTITDSLGNTGTFNCSVTVNAPPTISCVLINAVKGVPITPVTMTGSGGAGGPYTFSATGLPNGLTMAANGTISGTPTVSGTFTYTVTATDKNGNTGSSSCSVTVNVPPTASCVLINAVQGAAITPVTMTGSGGAGGPYTFSATGLPNGLTMAANGTISGTPTVSGAFNYTVTVTDKNGNTGSSNCTVTVNPPPPPVCVPATFSFTGNTSSSGTAGNTRTFTANGVSVKASAFSRTDSGGSWATAYLGLFSGGLGVTDGSEGDGSNNRHKVDNIGGRDNYVLFEFSSPVVINQAFLDIIGADSDISVWIGTKTDPFNNHLTLSDAVLSSLGFTEANETDVAASSRWANINAGGVSGNVVVISALHSDTTPEDEFKISKLLTQCPPAPQPLTAACVAATTGQVGVSYSSAITANGGVAPYTYALASGTLPAGLTLNPATGVISGTPTAAGPFPFAVKVTDSTGGTKLTYTTSACGITISSPASPPCVPSTFVFSGSTATSGTAGNTRTFTVNGVSVKASAFSRTDSSGAWATAYLGLYGPGLGVTDGSEGDGSNSKHKVDNIGGRDNYVLFEFSSPVVINKAFLDYLGTDSDIAVWIGTKNNPFANHLVLSDALLASLGLSETNETSASVTSRWADLNSGSVSGNVLVIAALDTDTTPEDEFKISKLETSCIAAAQPLTATCVTATTGTVGSSYSSTIVASGGVAPYTFALASGSLPAGLSLNPSTGAVSGTPTTSGSFPFSVKVTDSTGGTKLTTTTSSCGITIANTAPPPACVQSTLAFAGNTASSGTAGNSRTFTLNGVSVRATAFSRSATTTETWSKAYLGLYGSGLGVTDAGEGDGSNDRHKTDNIGGQINFVMFEFASPVVVNRVFLDAIGDDSDVSVFIGTKNDPYNNHLTLSDSLLASLSAYDEDETSSSVTSRWATVNAGAVSGNVFVISGLVSGSNDEFKISKLDLKKCQ